MTFQVPESKRSIEQNRFHFATPDGVAHSMPKAKFLTMGQLESLSKNPEEVSITDLLRLFGEDDETMTGLRDLDSDQLQALMEAWQADSQLQLGESSASA